VTRACACGGSISAPEDDPRAIQLAVEAHNAGWQHQAARRRPDWLEEPQPEPIARILERFDPYEGRRWKLE